RIKKKTYSGFADLSNTPKNNAGISAWGGWVVNNFCPPAIPWANVDITGTAVWGENGRRLGSG
ncbi:leucyl aminopeptidase family protein, partial [Enterobacter hormaechei]